jgi:molybdenum cofactor cytidylyltransferase
MVSMKAGSDSRVAAIILAAGRSTRMGQAKQLLRLGDSTVLGQTIANVRRSAVVEIVLVLGSSAQSILRQLALGEDLKVVVNQDYTQGMASSLRVGLSALDPRVDAALIVLADQPFIRPETLDLLANQHRSSKPQIVIPTYQGFRGNPVLLDRSVFFEVMALEGDVGCRAIFASHPEGMVKVEVEDAGILLDIDDQEDYKRLQTLEPSGQKATVAGILRKLSREQGSARDG